MSLFPKKAVRDLNSLGRIINLERPLLVGVLNVTPNSFSGDGIMQIERALEHARRMIDDGADWIDVGGESSGPGSNAISAEEELHRVIPLIEAIRKESNICVSIDTWRAQVARRAIDAGADVINDVTALRGDQEMIRLLEETQVPVIIMYSKDPNARTTTKSLTYDDVIQTIKDFFLDRLAWMKKRGIQPENIIIDPGTGFFVSGIGKYTFQIIRRLKELTEWGFPVMIGPSRKSFLANVGQGRNLAVHERELPSLIAAAISLWEGASLVRLHDVAGGRLMLDTLWAIKSS